MAEKSARNHSDSWKTRKERYKIMSKVTFRDVMPEFKSRRLPVRQNTQPRQQVWRGKKSLSLEANEEGTGLGQWFPNQLNHQKADNKQIQGPHLDLLNENLYVMMEVWGEVDSVFFFPKKQFWWSAKLKNYWSRSKTSLVFIRIENKSWEVRVITDFKMLEVKSDTKL